MKADITTGLSCVNDSTSTRHQDLRALLADLTPVVAPSVPVADLSLDSRRVSAGGAFVALPGTRTHGLEFVSQAIASGASIILWEPAAAPALLRSRHSGSCPSRHLDSCPAPNVLAPTVPAHVVSLAIPGLTALLGRIADRFFDAPSQAMSVIGITGTNGKTTTAYVVADALAKLGRKSAYAGTLGHGPVEAIKPGTHTTPDAVTVHRQLAELRADAVTHVAIEVTSHALDQHRVAGVRFHTALFTNLTHDHLDYHGTFAAYGAAKAKLFDWPELRHAVINVDDAFGRTLAFERKHEAVVTAFSATRSALPISGARQLFAERITPTASGLHIHVNGTWGAGLIASRFVGHFNVDNALGALAVLLGYDVPLADAIAAIEQCKAPPGRMETFATPGMPLAVVDYAHTPDALEKALSAVRQHCNGKLVCVFGCGGDRDATKRPVMGAIAERLADRVIVTDDNPRTEDGDAIIADILNGMKSAERVLIERDRAVAIERAIRDSGPNDAVLIAGKGHEDYQIVGLVRRYFSDRDVVNAVLRRRA